jgi:site-specific DNA-methyltransferase (adenine-specific)
MFLNNIYKINCREGFDTLLKTKADVIITSPPYNVKKEYESYKDNMPRKSYLCFMNSVFLQIKNALKEEGSFFLNIGGRPRDPLLPLDVIQCATKHFKLQNTIHWIKAIDMKDKIMGRHRNINSDKYLNNSHEYVLHFTKNGDVEIKKEKVHWRGNVWYIERDRMNKSKYHPTAFPENLVERCIRLHGIEKTNLVIDPFMGSGTVAVVCKKLGIDYLGFEIDNNAIRIANKRIMEV